MLPRRTALAAALLLAPLPGLALPAKPVESPEAKPVALAPQPGTAQALPAAPQAPVLPVLPRAAAPQPAGSAPAAAVLAQAAAPASPSRPPVEAGRPFDGSALPRPVAVPATPFAQRDITVLGQRLRYIDEGQGPPVLLIHGHTSRIEEYDALASRLSSRMRVIVPDLPGSGYSDKPVRDYTLAYYEEVLLAFMDGLGLSRFSVAGGSQGGNLAVRLAARAPERIERVAAWSPASAWTARPWAAKAIRLVGGKTLFWTVVERQSGYWFTPGWSGAAETVSRTFAYYREVMSPGFIRMYWGIAADTVGTSLFPLASRVRSPTLLVLGGLDATPGMTEGVERLAREIPGAKLVVYPDSGHAIATERPDDLAGPVLDFLLEPKSP